MIKFTSLHFESDAWWPKLDSLMYTCIRDIALGCTDTVVDFMCPQSSHALSLGYCKDSLAK